MSHTNRAQHSDTSTLPYPSYVIRRETPDWEVTEPTDPGRIQVDRMDRQYLTPNQIFIERYYPARVPADTFDGRIIDCPLGTEVWQWAYSEGDSLLSLGHLVWICENPEQAAHGFTRGYVYAWASVCTRRKLGWETSNKLCVPYTSRWVAGGQQQFRIGWQTIDDGIRFGAPDYTGLLA